jgi:hypothetical protein
MKSSVIFVLLLCLFVLIGCSKHVGLSGKVYFSDDQSPLTIGSVNFEKEDHFSRADLKPDGTFVVGSFGKTDGLPPGKYRVYITGARQSVDSGKEGTMGKTVFEDLIDRRFTSTATSGIVIDVTATTKGFEIEVDRPGTVTTNR